MKLLRFIKYLIVALSIFWFYVSFTALAAFWIIPTMNGITGAYMINAFLCGMAAWLIYFKKGIAGLIAESITMGSVIGMFLDPVYEMIFGPKGCYNGNCTGVMINNNTIQKALITWAVGAVIWFVVLKVCQRRRV